MRRMKNHTIHRLCCAFTFLSLGFASCEHVEAAVAQARDAAEKFKLASEEIANASETIRGASDEMRKASDDLKEAAKETERSMRASR